MRTLFARLIAGHVAVLLGLVLPACTEGGQTGDPGVSASACGMPSHTGAARGGGVPWAGDAGVAEYQVSLRRGASLELSTLYVLPTGESMAIDCQLRWDAQVFLQRADQPRIHGGGWVVVTGSSLTAATLHFPELGTCELSSHDGQVELDCE